MNKIASVPVLSEHDKQFCQQALTDLISKCKGLLSCVAASVDGFVVAQAGQNDEHAKRLAAMSSSATAVADAVVGELGYEKTEAIIIDASKGKIIILSVPTAKQDLVFLCACSSEALIGQVLYNTKNTANTLMTQLK